MPPLFTSTNINTLLRKVVYAARQSIQTAPRAIHYGAGRLSRIQQARLAIRHALHDTFPSLTHPRIPILQPIPLRLGSSTRPFSTLSHHFGSPMSRAARTIRFSAQPLPPSFRGARMVSHLGLGPARHFSTGPASSIINNIPVGCRAMSELLKDPQYERCLPRPTPVRRYDATFQSWGRRRDIRKRRFANSARRVSRLSVNSFTAQQSGEREHYFPLPSIRAEAASSPVLQPEEHVTPGRTTCLRVALSPSLNALLDPSVDITYADAEIGVSVLARLTCGALDIVQAYSIHAGHWLIPLLSRLENLGMIDTVDPTALSVSCEVLYNAEGQPDILVIVFPGRSIANIRTIVGESLSETNRGLFSLTEERALQSAAAVAPLSREETVDIMEEWGPASSASLSIAQSMNVSHIRGPSFELVIPTIDYSTILPDEDQTDDDLTPPESFSFPSSADISPLPSLPSSPSFAPRSLSSSLLSLLDDQSRITESDAWSVSPSEEDSDIESADLSGRVSGLWSSGQISTFASVTMLERVTEDGSEPSSPIVMPRWSGAGEGFGMAQPW